MVNEPILIDCEGSGGLLHTQGWTRSGICAMCGQVVTCDSYNRATHHQRVDVIEHIKRGDFDD